MTHPADPGAFPLEPSLAFLRRLWHLNHSLERLSSAMEKRLGVSAQQRFLLRCVGTYPGISAGQLGALLHLDPGTVSATVRRLEEKGLILRYRDPADARRVFLGLTPAALPLSKPAASTVEGAATTLLETTPPEAVELTLSVLERFTALLEADAGPDTRARAHAAEGRRK